MFTISNSPGLSIADVSTKRGAGLHIEHLPVAVYTVNKLDS